MPIIQMNLLEGRSAEMKRQAVKAVTVALVETLDVRPDQVRILINELPNENFAVGGYTVAERNEAKPK